MKRVDNQIRHSILVVATITFVLISLCLSGLWFINDQQNAKTNEFLAQMTTQYKASILRQIHGDIETLDGMVTILGEEEAVETEHLYRILEEINNANRFMRMGFIRTDGMTTMVDISGQRIENVDLSQMDYVKKALHGEEVITDTIKDSFGDGYINIYAVPIYHKGKIIGALCAVNDSEIYRSIVDLPSLGNGFAGIVKSDGALVIRSKEDPNQTYDNIYQLSFDRQDELEEAKQALKNKEDGSFMYHQQGNTYLAHFTSLGINDWLIVSMVPNSVLTSNLRMVSKLSIMAIIAIIILLSALLKYINKIILGSRKILENIAYFDELTNSYTKSKFLLEANALLEKSRYYSIVELDILNFKMINELFGYQAGDAFLKYFAKCLKEEIQTDELYYRHHADCFGLMLHEQDKQTLIKRMEKLKAKICSYELHPQQHYYIQCSCGIKIFDEREQNQAIDFVINRAMMALKECKKHSNSDIYIYDDKLYNASQHQSLIESRMETALQNHEFEVYLQPKHDIVTEKIVGAEALVRWNMDGKIIMPDEFIPLFEENGFITKLDMYVLDHAFSYMEEWQSKGYCIKQINVNQSRMLMYRSNYMEDIKKIIKRHHVDTSAIVLEVTESVALEDMEILKETIQSVHQLGFEVSMDDFGSGYSSLNVLQALPFDELKLDRFFVKDMGVDHEKQKKIIQYIIELNKSLNVRTVAEGVETKAQLEFLRGIGCDIAQGYYFSKPLPKNEFDKLLEKEQGNE